MAALREQTPGAGDEYDALSASLDEVASALPLEVPVVVVARDVSQLAVVPADALESLGTTPEVIEQFETIWRRLQEDVTTWSGDATLVVAPAASHWSISTLPRRSSTP